MTQERPLVFSGATVRAILDGRKAQTRRVVRGTGLAMLNDGSNTFTGANRQLSLRVPSMGAQGGVRVR